MLLDPDQLKALRDCCKDDASFAKLQRILASVPQHGSASVHSSLNGTGYEAILDAMPDRVFRLDQNGYYLDFKATQEDLELGILPEKVVGGHLNDFLPLEVAELCMQTIQQTLKTNTLQTCEYQLASPWEVNAELRDYEARIVPSGDLAVLTIVRDITDRKRAEKRLQQTEAQYRSIFEATTDGLIINDFERGTVVAANPACCKMHGYTQEEFVGLDPKEFIHPDNYSLFIEFLAEVKAGKTFRRRAIDLRKDGTPFHIEVIGTSFDYLGKPHALAVVRDITEQVKAEAALQASEARNRALVNALPDAMFRIHRDGTVLDVKAQATDLIAPLDQYPNRRIAEILPTALGCQWMHYIEQAVQTGEMQSFEYQVWLRGALHDREARMVPCESDEVVVIMRDITGRKQADRAIERERRLFVGGPVTVFRWIHAENWPVEYVSANVTQFGYQPDDFLSGRICYAQIVHPEDVARIDSEIQSYLEKGITTYEQDYRIIRADESVCWVHDHTSVVFDDQGKVTHFEGYVLDITERKQAEDALRESEEQFRCLVEQSLAGIYVIQQTHFLYVNPKFAEIFGYSQDEVLQLTVPDLIYPDDRPLVAENLRKRLDGEVQSMRYTFRGRRKGGQIIDVEVLGTKTEFDGQPAVIGTLLDVTERRQAEIALRESEEKFSTAFRCSPDPIIINTFADSRIIDVNDSFLKVSGYDRNEVVGSTIDALNLWVHPDTRLQLRQELYEKGAIRDFEFEFRRKNGEIGIGLFSAEMIDLKGEECLLAVPRDITERKQAEAQIRTAVERDRLLAQIALKVRRSLNLDQILTTTVAEVRQFLSADRVFIGQIDADWHGRVVAESAALAWGSILVWIADDIYLREIRTLFEQGRVQAIDDTTQASVSPLLAEYYAKCQIKASLGVPIILGEQFFGVLIVNQCSNPRHWQQFEIDLLEQLATQVAIAIQQAELYQQVQALNTNLERQVQDRTAQLQQKMQELQELSQIKEDFLHAVSHDLRTPVMGMALVLQNLAKKPGDTVSLSKSVLQRMIQSSDRQLSMINSLLEAHSSERRGVVLQYESVSLSTLVQTIVTDLEPLLTENQATLKNQIADDLPLITGDPAQLRRVYENLITNALKHNPPGLTITLEATVEEEMLCCKVQDDGVGMTDAECNSLFDRYARSSRARRSTGIGLGLYLCRQIITAHGGHISVNSALQQGATFLFTLPLVSS
jgi:PAS domain S-box-containing protein